MRRIDRNTNIFIDADTITKQYLRILLRKYRRMEIDVLELWLLMEDGNVSTQSIVQIISKINFEWASITVQIRNCLITIIKEVYLKTRKKPHDYYDPLFEIEYQELFEALWKEYGNVTHYQLSAELERRRARLIEAVMSVSTKRDLREQFNVSLRSLSKLLIQAGDDATYKAFLAALKDEDVSYGMLVTQRDARVCNDCRSHDGKIYSLATLHKMLPRHYNCRCFIIPVVRRPLDTVKQGSI